MSVATEAKSCCAAAYGSAAARFLLGDSFHPGGLALTRRLIEALGVGKEGAVLDVGSGSGSSALLLAEMTGCRVIGMDLARPSLVEAGARAARAGVAARLAVVCADAEALPFRDGIADGVLCECAFCLFPDAARAANELRRVLRRGGRLALSDVCADSGHLPAALRTLEAHVACLAGARPLGETALLLERAGFVIERIERHDAALREMLERIASRLRLARLLPASPLRSWLDRGEQMLYAARTALDDGVIGYGEVIARA